MDRSRTKRRTEIPVDSLSQPIGRRNRQELFLSQPSTSLTRYNAASQNSQIISDDEEAPSQRTQRSPPNNAVPQETMQLVSSLVRYILIMDRSKQAINRTRIVKNVLENRGKQFQQVMHKAKEILSKVFGYKLVEVEGNKYILVNEIQNDIPHIVFSKNKSAQQVLLFIILTHIFMKGESCSEDSLWDFLGSLGITKSDTHSYFGNAQQLILEGFLVQKYLDKVTVEQTEPPKIEFKWGIRAEHEFSRRAALEFVSQIYNGRAINNWPLQFKTMTAKEKSNKS